MEPTVREQLIPNGDSGSYATVARMRELVNAAIRAPLVVETAHRIALQFPPRAHVRIAIGIREWLKDNFWFVRDPVGVELVRDPVYLLRRYEITARVSGDCDDAAVLGCALAKSVGIPCKLATIGFGRGGIQFSPLSHIFGVMYPQSERSGRIAIDLDVTRPYGARAQVQRRLDFPV